MGKIILNDIEYGIGISNGVNVDTTNLVEKDSIVTTLDDTVTDEQIPSAKAVHIAIQSVSAGVPVDVYSKTEVDDLLADKADSTDIIDSYTKEEVDNLLDAKADSTDIVDAYTKTEVDGLLANKADSSAIIDAYNKTEVNDLLTAKADTTALEQLEGALTGYSTLEYLEEVKTDLENEIANINIPTTLPASDVYAWAKASTKPTYTASEVGALASNGTATNASKVSNALTLQIAGTTKNTFNGSSAQTFNIPNASTSTAGVMTKDMVTKLNGIATGATKNTIDTAMSSTSTNAVQNKVIYAYIQEQLKKAGDYMGKTMISVARNSTVGLTSGYTYTNAKGGFADFSFYSDGTVSNNFELIVDGVTIISGGMAPRILRYIKTNTYELKIPFTSTFTVKAPGSESYLHGFIYVNK